MKSVNNVLENVIKVPKISFSEYSYLFFVRLGSPERDPAVFGD